MHMVFKGEIGDAFSPYSHELQRGAGGHLFFFAPRCRVC